MKITNNSFLAPLIVIIVYHFIWESGNMYSGLSRCSTARGLSTGQFLVGPAKVKAGKYILFTEGSPEVKNKEHLFDLVVAL